MKTIAIINPISGGGRGKEVGESFCDFIDNRKLDCRVFYTERRWHATEIATKHAQNNDRVIIIGGDGTVNEVVNGVTDHDSVTFGLIPVGSGDDFARSLGLKRNSDQNFINVIKESPKLKTIDLWDISVTDSNGKIHLNRFTNSCGIGFDALVAHLNQQKKNITGLISYIITIFKALKLCETILISTKFDGQDSFNNKEILLFAIGNGKTAGGGLFLTPGGIIDDGILNGTALTPITRLALLRKLPLAVINKIERIQEAEFYEFSECAVNLNTPYYIHIDGEIITSKARDIVITKNPNPIKFIVG